MNTNYCELKEISEAIVEAMNIVEEVQRIETPGVPSGYPSIDRMTRGWNRGELIVIGGRPCVGKSTLLLRMARNCAVQFDLPAAVFSMQMSSVEASNRLISAETGIPMEKLEGFERMEKEDWIHVDVSLKKLAGSQLFIDDTPGLTPSDISERVRQLVKRRQVRAVFIDNLQAMIPDGKVDSPREARSEMLRSLKEIATTFGVPVIVLTNVGRPKKAGRIRPTVTDLDEYCPLSTDYADRIFLMDRPGLLRNDRDDEDLIGLELVRNKRGRTGFANFVFDVNHFGISELPENVKA
jgi:Replicative DNA helicase